MEPHQLVNEIYNKFKDEFVSDPEKGSFHNLLWKALINERYADEEAAFTVSVMEDNELIIADKKGGYWSTGVRFVNPDFNRSNEIIKELNEVVFKLTEDQATRIIMGSLKTATDE